MAQIPGKSRDQSSDQPIVKSAQSARGGVISGRIATVLLVSLFLAALMTAGLLIWWAYFLSPTAG